MFLGLAGSGLLFYFSNLDKLREKEFARGELYLAQAEYEKALDRYRAIYERHPDFYLSPKALFQSGEILNLYLKKYPEALLAYLLVEKDYPKTEWSLKAQQRVAEIYKTRLQDYGRAIVVYQRLLDSGAEQGDRFQYEVADTYFRLNNFEQARIEFESLLKNYPESSLIPEVLYRIAVTYALEGEHDDAEKEFRQVIQDWPDSSFVVEARFGLASVLEEKGELRECLKILEGLQGKYQNAEVLAKKTKQVRERIKKKKKAI